MAEKFSKREFVDENPYIVYTGEEDKVFRIENGSISTAQIADGAITTGKIANGAVTASQIANGVIPEPYTLPTASDSTLGGVKVGDGLSITDGVLSANGGGGDNNVMVVNWTRTGASQQTVDYTASEIAQAIAAGKIVIIKYTDNINNTLPKPLYCYLDAKLPGDEYSPASYVFVGVYYTYQNSKAQMIIKKLMVDATGTTFTSSSNVDTITSA